MKHVDIAKVTKANGRKPEQITPAEAAHRRSKFSKFFMATSAILLIAAPAFSQKIISAVETAGRGKYSTELDGKTLNITGVPFGNQSFNVKIDLSEPFRNVKNVSKFDWEANNGRRYIVIEGMTEKGEHVGIRIIPDNAASIKAEDDANGSWKIVKTLGVTDSRK